MSDDSLVAMAAPVVSRDPYFGPQLAPYRPTQAPLQPRQPFISRYFREVLKRLWLVLLLAGIAGGAVFVSRSDGAASFESTAVVRVLVSDQVGDDGSITAFQSRQLAELTLTPTLVADAASRAGLDISTAEARSRISVDLRDTPGFVDVTALGPSAEEAQLLAQGAAEVMADVSSQDAGPTITVIEPATGAASVTTDALRYAILAALAIAALTSALIVLVRKALGRISPVSPEVEVERIAGVPTVNLNVGGEPGGATAPFFAVHLYDAPVITVLQRNGPATVEFASALAETAANFNRRVMMIDSDAAKPILHERFGHPQAPGLAEVLAGLEPLRRVVRRASETNPTAVLTAGSGKTELFGVERIIGAHQIVKASGADCAIVSTTSNSTLHDALMVAHHFPDAVVVALDPKQTTQAEVRELTNRVHSVGGRLVGIVLHDGRRLDTESKGWRERRAARRNHMRRRVARDWSER